MPKHDVGGDFASRPGAPVQHETRFAYCHLQRLTHRRGRLTRSYPVLYALRGSDARHVLVGRLRLQVLIEVFWKNQAVHMTIFELDRHVVLEMDNARVKRRIAGRQFEGLQDDRVVRGLEQKHFTGMFVPPRLLISSEMLRISMRVDS